jgi:hypothetical protein
MQGTLVVVCVKLEERSLNVVIYGSLYFMRKTKAIYNSASIN